MLECLQDCVGVDVLEFLGSILWVFNCPVVDSRPYLLTKCLVLALCAVINYSISSYNEVRSVQFDNRENNLWTFLSRAKIARVLR